MTANIQTFPTYCLQRRLLPFATNPNVKEFRSASTMQPLSITHGTGLNTGYRYVASAMDTYILAAVVNMKASMPLRSIGIRSPGV